MATISVINGVAVNIGFAGTPNGISISSPAISTKVILQSADESVDAERILIHDEVGNRVGSSWVDQVKKATLELLVKGTGLTDAIASTQLVEAISPGDLMVITSCQQMPGLVGTNWEVQSGPKLAGTNKDAKKFTLPLEKAPGITQAAGA
jgi:hypothetical protein